MPYVRIIHTARERASLVRDLERSPLGYTVEIRRDRRTTDQNRRMWAMLTDVSRQLQWHGQTLSPEDWKIVMLAGLNQELRMVPNIDGNGFVQLGRSSSKLSKEEMGQLMDLIEAFGAKHGVEFSEPAEVA